MTKREVFTIWINAGSGVIPIGADKRPTGIWGGPLREPETLRVLPDVPRLRNPRQIDALAACAVVPQEAGFVVLDLDNGEGKNPLMDIQFVWLEKFGKPFPYQVHEFEPRTETPSGGFHLWFTCPLETAYVRGTNPATSDGRHNIEIKGATKYVLMPGSRTPKGEYRLIGDLPAAPPLPEELIGLSRWTTPPPRKYRSVFHDNADIDRMLQFYLKKYPDIDAEGWNNFAFKFASFCSDEGVDVELCIQKVAPHCIDENSRRRNENSIRSRYERGR